MLARNLCLFLISAILLDLNFPAPHNTFCLEQEGRP